MFSKFWLEKGKTNIKSQDVWNPLQLPYRCIEVAATDVDFIKIIENLQAVFKWSKYTY